MYKIAIVGISIRRIREHSKINISKLITASIYGVNFVLFVLIYKVVLLVADTTDPVAQTRE
jgi:hypothetical protein